MLCMVLQCTYTPILGQYINPVQSHGSNQLQLQIVWGKFCSFLNITELSQLKLYQVRKMSKFPLHRGISCQCFKKFEIFKSFTNFMILQKYMLCMVLQGTHIPIFKSISQSSTKLWPFLFLQTCFDVAAILNRKIMKI